MSILLHLYYTGKDGGARRFAREMESGGTAEAVRREDGNEQYRYFFPADDRETVLLVVQWRDQAAIDRHHASPMMEVIRVLRDKYDLRMRAERYLSEEGLPPEDARFLRT
ncbi:MAG: antibiotic biosynthesis monooxygenase family protein [Christensenellales bacterium]